MSVSSEGLSDADIDAVESFLFDWATQFDVPGVAASVVTPETEEVATAVGARRLIENNPATPDTLYAVGSVSKSFTATAVMQLVDAGEISLDDSPAAYTPADFDGVEDITLHDLLCHGSGLPSLAVSEGLIAQQTGYTNAPVPIGDHQDFYRYLNGAGDERLDGDWFLYSNSGYMLLADVVRTVTNRRFADVIQTEVLEPLGMVRSTMDGADFADTTDTMTPYRRAEDGDGWEETPVPIRELSRGPGGLFTSVRELGSYLQMYLNDGVADTGARVLSSAAIDQMTGGHTDTPVGPYGYGWRTVDLNGWSLVGHGGSVGVATAYAGWSSELGLGVAVACNASSGHGLRVLGEGLVLTAIGEDPYATHPFFETHRRRRLLSGRYETYRGARTARVERGDGLLRFQLEEPLPLEPTALVYEGETEDGYRYWAPTDDGRMPVEFIVDGSTVELIYDRWRLHQSSTD